MDLQRFRTKKYLNSFPCCKIWSKILRKTNEQCEKRTTPYSGRAIHVGPFHVHPIHVETDSCPERPIHVRPYSCPNLFVPNGTDSCPTPFMSTYSCPTLFMSDPIHVQKTDSCLTLFMSDPIHVQKDLFMSNIYIKESLTLANLT